MERHPQPALHGLHRTPLTQRSTIDHKKTCSACTGTYPARVAKNVCCAAGGIVTGCAHAVTQAGKHSSNMTTVTMYIGWEQGDGRACDNMRQLPKTKRRYSRAPHSTAARMHSTQPFCQCQNKKMKTARDGSCRYPKTRAGCSRQSVRHTPLSSPFPPNTFANSPFIFTRLLTLTQELPGRMLVALQHMPATTAGLARQVLSHDVALQTIRPGRV